MKKTWIKIKRGLLTPKHRETLGIRVWLYIYMLDLVDWETGIVYGWKDKDEASDFCMPHKTLQKQRQQLEKDGYISCRKRPYCLDITIHKWTNPREYSGKVYNNKKESTQNRVDTNGDGKEETTHLTPHQTPHELVTELGIPSLYSDVKDHTPQDEGKTENPKNPNPFPPKDPPPPREPRTVESNKASTLEALKKGQERNIKGDPDLWWLSESLIPYAKTFIQAAGEVYTPLKDDYNLWRKELAIWQKTGIGLEVIKTAVNKMRRDGLTIKGPQSIRGVCINLIATDGSNGNQGSRSGTTRAELETDGYKRM